MLLRQKHETRANITNYTLPSTPTNQPLITITGVECGCGTGRLRNGLYDARAWDWVILSDVDEVPHPDQVRAVVHLHTIASVSYGFRCRDFFYYNYKWKGSQEYFGICSHCGGRRHEYATGAGIALIASVRRRQT